MRMTKRVETDHAEVLAEAIRSRINGEVRFDAGSRALYAADASNYRQVPIGVVIPKTAEDVIETIEICRRYGAPILPRGAGTSLAGQTCNVAVVIDFSKYMNRIIEIDPDRKRARVEPGVVLDNLRSAAERFDLTFGPDPATHRWCTLGGMIGNNSCGIHSVMAGRTADNIETLEILTHDGLRMQAGKTGDDALQRIIQEGGRRGEIYAKLKSLRDRHAGLIRERFPRIPRRVSGYSLEQLLPENGFDVARALVGSEGTCVTVLEAVVKLVPSPPKRALAVLGYPDVFTAGDHITEVMAHGPVGLEGIDDRLVGYIRKKHLHAENVDLLPEGGGWLLVEFGGEDQKEANARGREMMEALRKGERPPAMHLYADPEDQERIWEIRESGLGATAFVPGEKDSWPGWEDSAVHPERLGDYLRDLRRLLDRHGYQCALYGHFGQACVHTRIDFDLITKEGIDRYRAFLDEAAETVLRYGGSFSGEHGDGQARGELLQKMYGPELTAAFREFKSIWDPSWKMNPGKVIEPDLITENLRLGTGYNPPAVETYFQYPEDGSFAHATLRCVGVGKCRRESGGTMCPSYMVTREEKDTTRGRAHALFEMLQGDPITEGWRDDHVEETLDLCLACKGCKGDCPVNVDIATYKAEFRAHYYKGRLRPRSAYSMGLIYGWSRLASTAPRLANFVMQTPWLSGLAKAVGDIAPERRIPAFATETFRDWFRRREAKNAAGPRVLLWPDTFNNFFYPDTAKAAVEVLEGLGYRVEIPRRILCCGRPLYDFGFLDRAKKRWRQTLAALQPEIEAGIPVVGLEPSCVAAFRDELVNLFPRDEDALRLSRQTFMLSEFLEKKVDHFQPPRLARKAVVHGHCHHKAIMKLNDEEKILAKLGLDFEILDSGCCGMAGAFGFEKAHYDVSIASGERVLLPAVREADAETLILSDGFSCREQIAQTTNRRALHLAEVLQMAMRPAPSETPSENGGGKHRLPVRLKKTAPLLGAGALLAGAALAWGLKRRSAA
ncbi:FAD-binding and (Fe-S)-binding domain-containing protein [Candidatus Manganitrophus noduliformans]|nr:FAD-binding and (Fe-S)-binding domain-containing protein [Candidatus Manganitrophus noduliformans]